MKTRTRMLAGLALLCVAGLNTGCAGVKLYAKTMQGGGVQAGLETVDRGDVPKVIDASLTVDGFDASMTVHPMQALRDFGAGVKEVIAWSKTLRGPPASLAMGASVPADGG